MAQAAPQSTQPPQNPAAPQTPPQDQDAKNKAWAMQVFRASAAGYPVPPQMIEIAKKYIDPESKIMQTPDGDILAVNPRNNKVEPIYKTQPKGVILPEGARLAHPVTGEPLGAGNNPGPRMLVTPEERRAAGIPDDDKGPYGIDKGKLYRAGGPQVQIDQRGESAEQAAIGKGAGARANETINAAKAAGQKLIDLNNMKALLANIQTGAVEPGRMTIAAWGKSLGLGEDALRSIGLKPEAVGDAQALEAMSRAVAMSHIGSGGIPANNFSEADRKFVISLVPGLARDPRANEIMNATAERQAMLAIQKNDEWLQFRHDPANKGKSYDDFENAWTKKLAAQDIFGDLRRQAEAIIGRPSTAPAGNGNGGVIRYDAQGRRIP
jgi:hypothetical protein